MKHVKYGYKKDFDKFCQPVMEFFLRISQEKITFPYHLTSTVDRD